MKVLLALAAVLVMTSSSVRAVDNEEVIYEDDLLEFLHDSLATCYGITKVTRSGSDFRIIDFTNSRREFSLKDMRVSKGNPGDWVELRCGPPGCVAQYSGIDGKWQEVQPANRAYFQCDGDLARRMRTVLRYYQKNYSD